MKEELDFRKFSLAIFLLGCFVWALMIFNLIPKSNLSLQKGLALILLYILAIFTTGLLTDYFTLLYFKLKWHFKDWQKINWRAYSQDEATQNIGYVVNILRQKSKPFVAVFGLFFYRLYVPPKN